MLSGLPINANKMGLSELFFDIAATHAADTYLPDKTQRYKKAEISICDTLKKLTTDNKILNDLQESICILASINGELMYKHGFNDGAKFIMQLMSANKEETSYD